MAYRSNTVDTVIKTIQIGDNKEVRVTQLCDKYGNLQSVDIRQWYCNSTDSEMKPSKSGIRISADFCSELLEGIIKSCSPDVLLDLMEHIPSVKIDIDELEIEKGE